MTTENLEDKIKILILKPHSNGIDKIVVGKYADVNFTYMTKNGLFATEGLPEKESSELLAYLKNKYNPKQGAA